MYPEIYAVYYKRLAYDMDELMENCWNPKHSLALVDFTKRVLFKIIENTDHFAHKYT